MATVKCTLSYMECPSPGMKPCWPKVVTRMADAIVIPISKPFGQVPKHKVDDDAIELPAKRSMVRSFSINHDTLPESKPLLVSFGQVPKCKAEGNSPGPPPKKRAIKSPSTCHVMPQECCLWQLPNGLLFDIMDLLDTGWLDVNEAGCVALPVWRHIAFRAVDVMWFTSSQTLSRHQLGAMFPPYYPEENALSSILSCTEYLPQLPSLEISMPMITSANELATFAAFPTNDKCILPAWHLTFRGTHPVHSMPDVLDVIVDPSLLRCTRISSIPSPNRISKFQLFHTSMYWDILYPFTQQNTEISTILYLCKFMENMQLVSQ
ncbi:hypothetical protein EDC04DRAFT_2599473 [Pisolithus marmoratus]|nr:hypothetical protein EDC04DRAFT_2599473 [Pisolithus marmoratus]